MNWRYWSALDKTECNLLENLRGPGKSNPTSWIRYAAETRKIQKVFFSSDSKYSNNENNRKFHKVINLVWWGYSHINNPSYHISWIIHHLPLYIYYPSYHMYHISHYITLYHIISHYITLYHIISHYIIYHINYPSYHSTIIAIHI